MIYPILTNYLSVISRYRLYQILSYLLHESFSSNFVLLNLVKYLKDLFKKQKYRIYQKSNQLFSNILENFPSDIVNFEKTFKDYEDFIFEITGNSLKSSKNLAIFGDVIIGYSPFPLRHQLLSFGNPSPSVITSYVNEPGEAFRSN